jgi:hypothetical protein
MKPLSRRSVTTGMLAGVAAIPAVGLCAALKSNAKARIEYHTRELEKAMREAYGVEVDARIWDGTDGAKPIVLVVAHTR